MTWKIHSVPSLRKGVEGIEIFEIMHRPISIFDRRPIKEWNISKLAYIRRWSSISFMSQINNNNCSPYYLRGDYSLSRGPVTETGLDVNPMKDTIKASSQSKSPMQISENILTTESLGKAAVGFLSRFGSPPPLHCP